MKFNEQDKKDYKDYLSSEIKKESLGLKSEDPKEVTIASYNYSNLIKDLNNLK